MKNFLMNKRSLALIFWIVMVIVAIVTMPNLNKLVQEKGQITLPENFESEQANVILNDMNNDGESIYEFILVTHNKDGITATEKKELNKTLQYFKDHSDEYDITDTFFYNESEQASKQLVSDDKTTILNKISTKKGLKSSTDIANEFEKQLKKISATTYITGADVVKDDFTQMSQEGVQKTEIVAIIFIILILVIIFRSPVIPIVSLLSVGVAYIVSLNVIAQLVHYFNFPFSTFTQVFLVVILFGIGTDYNILLFTRFREELATKGHILHAIKNTYKAAGKTVLYSGIAVLLGLSALFFAEFNFYQSTGGVAIGVFVMLIVLFTLNPFFMALLGSKLFWPIKKINSHTDNKLWTFLSKNAFMRPVLNLVIVALIVIPSIWIYSGNLNFNDLTEIDDKYESKQAITLISEHFPEGMSAPATVVIKHSKDLASTAALQEIDSLTTRLQEINGVDHVYSATRPEGKKIEALYLENQLTTLQESLGDMETGVNSINSSLQQSSNESATAQQQVLAALPAEIAEQMQAQLTAQAKGLTQVDMGLRKIEAGLKSSQNYLSQTASNQQQTLNIPDDILTSEDFKKSLDTYMDDERKTTTLTIVFDSNPYSAEAMEIAKETKDVVHSFMEGSSLHQAKAYLSGKTMENVDLQQMSHNDFKRSIIIILIGISIMLLFITRSLAQTLTIIVALVAACFASLGLTEWVTSTLLGEEKMSWNVPFFTFIMLITLGVDYSIFLLMRFKEGQNNNLEMIVEACKKMGGVILSAAIILGGTFAALMPSGINSLIQIAISVIIGLLFLTLLLMPIFVPSVFSLSHKANRKKQ